MADMETPTKFRKVTNFPGYKRDSKQLFPDNVDSCAKDEPVAQGVAAEPADNDEEGDDDNEELEVELFDLFQNHAKQSSLIGRSRESDYFEFRILKTKFHDQIVTYGVVISGSN